MYVSGRPDWNAPQIALAARLSDDACVIAFSDMFFIMDEPPRQMDEPPRRFSRRSFGLR
jgi:hypothetical protein